MTTPIKIKRSGTASSTPSSLDHGELAINYADATLFWKDDANVIQSFVFQAYASATHKSQHATGGSDALTPADIGAAPAASPAITGNATFSASSGVPVTITNTGTGNSFVVNDIAGDATPFLVDADGRVGVRGATPSGLHSLFNTLCVGAGGAAAQGITIFSQSVCTLAFGDTAAGDSADSSRGYVSYSHTTDTLTIGTNNATRITVDSIGKVGVNRTSPASALDVNGVITVSATSGSAGSYLPSLTISGDPNTGFGQVSGQSDTASVFTAGHERVRVDSSGRVGINATPNSRRLTVRGSSTGDGAVLLQSSSTPATTTNGFIIQCLGVNSDAYVWNFENAPIIFGANNAERMRLYADGKLDVTNSVWAVNGSAGSPGFTFRNDTNTGIFQASGSADTLSISTAGVERVRVTSGGNLLLGGTASPTSAVGALAIFNGTAPTASVTNGVVLYSEDVSSSAELKVRDEAGNVTTLSPHNFDLIPDGPSEPMAWAYYSERDGHRINVDMLRLARLVERLTGEKLVYEAGP